MPHSSVRMRVSIDNMQAFEQELLDINEALGSLSGQGNEGNNLGKAFKALNQIKFLNIKVCNKVMAQEMF